MTTGLIYVLFDSASPHDYRYVGKTVGSLDVRLRGHLQNKHKTYATSWIKSVVSSGRRVCIMQIDEVSRDDLNFTECMWIATLRAAGYRLTNSAEGGHGGNVGEAANRKISEKMKAHWSEERKAEQSARMAEWWTEERRAEYSEKMKGLWPSRKEEHSARMHDWWDQLPADKREAHQRNTAESWTDERRARQSEVARSIPKEKRTGGYVKWTDERKASGRAAWTPERKAAHAAACKEWWRKKKAGEILP